MIIKWAIYLATLTMNLGEVDFDYKLVEDGYDSEIEAMSRMIDLNRYNKSSCYVVRSYNLSEGV